MMGTTDRKATLVDVSTLREGDEMAWNTRQRPAKVKGIDRTGPLLKVFVEGLGERQAHPGDRVLRYEPRPSTKAEGRKAGAR